MKTKFEKFIESFNEPRIYNALFNYFRLYESTQKQPTIKQVRALCISGRLFKARNLGQKSFQKICASLGVTPKPLSTHCRYCCPRCGFSGYMKKLSRLKKSDVFTGIQG